MCVVVAARLPSYKCSCKEVFFFFSVFLVEVLLSLWSDTQRAWSEWRTQLRKSLFVFHFDVFWGGYWLICLCWWQSGNLWICLVKARLPVCSFYLLSWSVLLFTLCLWLSMVFSVIVTQLVLLCCAVYASYLSIRSFNFVFTKKSVGDWSPIWPNVQFHLQFPFPPWSRHVQCCLVKTAAFSQLKNQHG